MDYSLSISKHRVYNAAGDEIGSVAGHMYSSNAYYTKLVLEIHLEHGTEFPTLKKQKEISNNIIRAIKV